MPVMYMPVTNDEYELPLAPPMYSRGAVDCWGRKSGCAGGMRIVGVKL